MFMRIENMTTNENDEIKQKASEKEWDYSTSFKDKADDYENYLMNEARADTAKQIFKELEDNVIHIRGNNEDIGIFLSSAKNYFALKKEYKIEE